MDFGEFDVDVERKADGDVNVTGIVLTVGMRAAERQGHGAYIGTDDGWGSWLYGGHWGSLVPLMGVCVQRIWSCRMAALM